MIDDSNSGPLRATEPAPGIVVYAEQHADVALIAMATHGRSGLSRLWLGSIAMKVVQDSTHPVLLVRAKERAEAAQFSKGRVAATSVF